MTVDVEEAVEEVAEALLGDVEQAEDVADHLVVEVEVITIFLCTLSRISK